MFRTDFTSNISALREEALAHIEDGPLTKNYEADVHRVIHLLNIAYATEMVCVLRYKNHYYKASELGATVVADEFLEHAHEEQAHADKLAERIGQLGGVPHMGPDYITKNAHSQYVECLTVEEMIKENLVAERIAVENYRDLIRYVGDKDPVTRRLLEEILMVEEEHADDLLDFQARYKH